MELTPQQIRERIESGNFQTDADDDDNWGYTLDSMTDTHGETPLLAWTRAVQDYSGQPVPMFDATDFERRFTETYQGEWDTPGDFVYHYIMDAEQQCGDEGEAKGFARALEMLKKHVDWKSAAEDGGITEGYTMIMLDPENSRTVHVFELGA